MMQYTRCETPLDLKSLNTVASFTFGTVQVSTRGRCSVSIRPQQPVPQSGKENNSDSSLHLGPVPPILQWLTDSLTNQSTEYKSVLII